MFLIPVVDRSKRFGRSLNCNKCPRSLHSLSSQGFILIKELIEFNFAQGFSGAQIHWLSWGVQYNYPAAENVACNKPHGAWAKATPVYWRVSTRDIIHSSPGMLPVTLNCCSILCLPAYSSTLLTGLLFHTQRKNKSCIFPFCRWNGPPLWVISSTIERHSK